MNREKLVFVDTYMSLKTKVTKIGLAQLLSKYEFRRSSLQYKGNMFKNARLLKMVGEGMGSV